MTPLASSRGSQPVRITQLRMTPFSHTRVWLHRVSVSRWNDRTTGTRSGQRRRLHGRQSCCPPSGNSGTSRADSRFVNHTRRVARRKPPFPCVLKTTDNHPSTLAFSRTCAICSVGRCSCTLLSLRPFTNPSLCRVLPRAPEPSRPKHWDRLVLLVALNRRRMSGSDREVETEKARPSEVALWVAFVLDAHRRLD